MYESAYKVNKETGRCVIELALDGYHDFFHEWDNASYKRRDLHPELTGFLDMCSEDIPLKKELEIRIEIGKEPKDDRMEDNHLEGTILASDPELPRSNLALSRIFHILLPDLPRFLHLTCIRESMEEPLVPIGDIIMSVSPLVDESLVQEKISPVRPYD